MQHTNLSVQLSLEKQIVIGRRKLQALWDIRGRTDSDVLVASIELDELMNQCQRLSAGVKNEDSGNRQCEREDATS